MKKFILKLIILFPSVGFAVMQPHEVFGKNCLEYYQNSYLSFKNHKAFAYVREEQTGKDRCVSWYGFVSINKAKNAALSDCMKYKLKSECIIVDVDGKFDVADKKFTKLIPADTTPLSDTEISKLMIDAKSIIIGNCYPFFKKFLKLSEHKAFAYSIDQEGKYACGYSYNNQTEKISKKTAIKACEEDKLKRDDKTPKSPCKVYATNKKILLNAKDFGVEVEKKEDIFLSSEVYSKKLEQAKNIMDDGDCLLQIKYYLRGQMQQAYYFVKSNGEEACGVDQDAFTLKIAKENAKKSCNTMAKKKNIKAECKLFAQNFEIVAKASDYVVKMSEKGYERALHKGKLKEVKKYIAKGYDVNMQTKKDGITPLFLAAAKGDKAFFFELVKKGADLKHKAKDGSSLLHATVLGENIELVSYLLDKGFDINAKGFDGNTPLHTAIAMLNIDIVKLLIQNGAATDIKNNKGKLVSELLGGLKLNLDDLKPKEENLIKKK